MTTERIAELMRLANGAASEMGARAIELKAYLDRANELDSSPAIVSKTDLENAEEAMVLASMLFAATLRGLAFTLTRKDGAA
jgi:hypothetical protein